MSGCFSRVHQPLWAMSVDELRTRKLTILRAEEFDRAAYNAVTFVLDNKTEEARRVAVS